MSSDLKQNERIASFRTPLGPNFFTLVRFEAEEALSELFVYEIEAVSTTENADLESIIGDKCSVTYKLRDGSERVFHGILVEAHWMGRSEDLYAYRFVLRPWLWLLSQRSDCRIFKNKTPIDIIKLIFQKEDKNDFEDKTSEKPDEIAYCVQYRETDLDFVCRLMEKYGIYYYFRHSGDGHKLVLADARSSHAVVNAAAEPLGVPGGAYPFSPKIGKVRRQVEHIVQWSTRRRLRTGKVVLRDYDYDQSTSDLTAESEQGTKPAKKYEAYDYPGAYVKRQDGERFAKVRAEAAQAVDQRRSATGDAASLFPGALMQLSDHPTGSENGEYLVVSASHAYGVQAYRSNRRSDDQIYHGAYDVLKSDRRFRAPLVTAPPVVQGPHTARVVGEKNRGEEGDIDVDKYGCILLRFHWDREDESTSRRVRVAQMWSGREWGGHVIPRIGQEVVVEFLEGDPDQPIVVGTVVNDQHMPPYEMPADKTQSGLKSESTEGRGFSGAYNEIKFEDRYGNEMFSMRAEKDMFTLIRNVEKREIGENYSGDNGGNSRETTIKQGNDRLVVETGKRYVEAMTEMKLVVGQSSITMTPATIEIKSPTITITSTAKTDVLSDATVIVNAPIVKIN